MSLHAHFLRTFSLVLLTGALVGPSPAARAQDVGSSVVTAALGVPENPDTGAPPAVYLTWWPTGTGEWSPRSYAVYSKKGLPDDPGSFSLAGLVQPQVDVLAVGFSLNRAERVGEDLDALSDNIDGLYDKIVPVGGMQLSEKLAAIVAVSELDAESAETLALLTRRHPAAALAAGVAFVDAIPAGEVRTYEIRTGPEGSNSPAAFDSVSGRVVVKGGQIDYLPAPGEPVHVPFVNEEGGADPRGNLNVPLRWATPDPLRERSFFQFGFDIYRVSAAYAKSRNWDVAAPDRGDFLDTLAAKPELMARVNDLPILTDEVFDASDVADLGADPKTYFVIDDNRRYEPGGEPFEDGDTFFYFVAGRDLLGRPGAISEGTPVTVCFRIPPQSPRGLDVTNHYTWDSSTDTQKQVFKISWNAALRREHGPDIAGYWIYRWESLEEMQQMQGLPFSDLPGDSLTGGRVATVPAGVTEYIDDVGPHPFVTYSREGDLETAPVVDDAEANKTYWYTVRAIDDSACSANISGNSAPAYGVLRGRVGPDAPSGAVQGDCVEPFLDFQRAYAAPSEETFDERFTYLRLSVQRFSPDIAWAEFYLDSFPDERAFLGRFPYTEDGGDILIEDVKLRTAHLVEGDKSQGLVVARVGTANGEVSEFVEADFSAGLQPDPKTGNFTQRIEFNAMADKERGCTSHNPDPVGGVSGTVTPIDLTLNLTPNTEEWKLYRKVGNGSISLLEQGIGSYDSTPVISMEDGDLPLNGAQICYYLQVFDAQGNPSVLQRIGCITSGPRTPLPAPMLSPVQPQGNSPAKSGAKLSWFAAPAGIERFEVQIAREAGRVAETISDDLRLNIEPGQIPLLSLRYQGFPTRVWRSFLTGRIGANFGSGPNYEVAWTENLSSGTEYFIRIRAIGAGKTKGPWSNVESFVWSSEVDFSQPFDPGDCVVPWPVRGNPGVDPNFPVPEPIELIEVGLKAEINPTDANGGRLYNGGAVRVGLVRLDSLDVQLPKNWDRLGEQSDTGIFQLPAPKEGKGDLKPAFYQRQNGTPLLNFMLFRYQVPNEIWPSVSGDVYQVSPLIEGMAHTEIEFQGQPAFAVHDPYFFLMEAAEGSKSRAYHLYVKDTQPIISQASYRYLVVRFDESGEIDQVIPLPTVTAN